MKKILGFLESKTVVLAILFHPELAGPSWVLDVSVIVLVPSTLLDASKAIKLLGSATRLQAWVTLPR